MRRNEKDRREKIMLIALFVILMISWISLSYILNFDMEASRQSWFDAQGFNITAEQIKGGRLK